MATDALLTKPSGKDYYDISWTTSGDLATTQSLSTFIGMTLFEEVRATASEVIDNFKRRGWVGNQSTPGFQQGSKAWLFEQERITGSLLSELGSVIENAMEVLIDEELASNVIVDTPRYITGKVIATIHIEREGEIVESLTFELWENTKL